MGCNVVSVYNDEVVGKMGYPQLVLDDLSSRDFRQRHFIENSRDLQEKVSAIYGYTQSFTTTRLFAATIKNKQHLVYTAGRFIVLYEPSSSRKIAIANQQYITSFMVQQKWCVVALNGGTVLLWDLQFLEIKLEILLPQNSVTVSTVGFSQKYIFVTDSSRPNNIVYIYDIRTAKMLAHGLISSFQPLLRSISVGQDLHVATAADGVWFMRFIKQDKELEVVRGMFGHFPKTSMLCVANFGPYVVSGGVDGYVYIWLISNYQCLKAIKVAECQITAVGVKNKQIMVGCSQGRIKVFTFEILKKKKSQTSPTGQGEQQNEDVAFIMVDSYLETGQTICICGSQVQPYTYYCFTREGLFFKKALPALTSQKKLVNPQLLNNIYLQKFAAKSKIVVSEKLIYAVYFNSRLLLCLDLFIFQNHILKLKQERQFFQKQPILNEQQLDFNLTTNQVCYLTKDKKLKIGLTYEKGLQPNNPTNSVVVAEFQNQNILTVNFLQSKSMLICVTTDQTIAVFQRVDVLKYEQKCYLKHQNKIPESLKVQDQQFIFQHESKKWKHTKQSWKPYDAAEIERLKTVHCGQISSRDSRWSQQNISCGQGFAILWKN